jgi:demethylmenaquinone methyltransferase/2-methoxy-6-polyprenyl-1,4-benzoquinol methylase
MANGEYTLRFAEQEKIREEKFKQVWTEELDDVFTDVARYYDRANHIACLGLWNWLRKSFLSTIELQSGQKVLDVCAGTNAIGIALLNKNPDLDVKAIDRSVAMQKEGLNNSKQQGLHIDSTIGDVHRLPFPDNYFDVVTLQYASRHLRIIEVFGEIKRVLKPGGHFYHCDMLRPENKLVEQLYYGYLRLCLSMTGWLFSSAPSALACKKYFVNALSMFYSASELSSLLVDLGFQQVSSKTVLGGMVGFHKAVKYDNR